MAGLQENTLLCPAHSVLMVSLLKGRTVDFVLHTQRGGSLHARVLAFHACNPPEPLTFRNAPFHTRGRETSCTAAADHATKQPRSGLSRTFPSSGAGVGLGNGSPLPGSVGAITLHSPAPLTLNAGGKRGLPGEGGCWLQDPACV